MKYAKCVVCGFNVTEHDERCQNCGVQYPLRSLIVRPRDYSDFVTLATVFAVLAPLLVFGLGFGFNPTVCFAIPICLISVFVVRAIATSMAISRSNRLARLDEARIAQRTAPYPDSLTSRVELINGRVLELSKREQQVNAVLARITQSTDDKWQRVQATLEASTETLQRQRARYRTKAVEIDLVRLQNSLAPLVYHTEKFTFAQITWYLETIDETQQTIGKLRGQLDEQRSILGSAPELEDLFQRISEVQSSIRLLHDALVSRQAVLALEDITPLDAALAPDLTPVAAIRDSEVFNIQVAITDFSTAFAELESEYARLQAEEDIARQVNEIKRLTGT